jgi:hypothetical protein
VRQSTGSSKRPLCTGSECICASACGFIWFGAIDRGGTVGLHRPRTGDAAFKALAPSEASVVYKRMLDNITRYLEEMETPKPLIDSMVGTGSADIQWVDFTRALTHPPSIAEWIDASCGPFADQDYDTLDELSYKADRTRVEDVLLKSLRDKWSKRIHCWSDLVETHRKRLTPP